MQDKIEREITVKASKERVYQAITDPEQITSWFPDGVEGKLEEGEQPLLVFGEHGRARILVVSKKPNDYFAYRWVPGAGHYDGDVNEVKTTLVEFNLSEADGVTTVSLVESGFSGLAPELAETSLKQNTGGWKHMLARLETKLSE